MPELVELQKNYVDRGVTIIGVTDEGMEEVKSFLDKKCHHDENMTYRELTSGYCLVSDPDGTVFNDYMRGVERRSFPTVAIVGKTGLIEYIGSANGFKSSLENIVNGTWDREARRKEQDANLAARTIMYELHDLNKSGRMEEAIEVLNRQVESADQRLRTVSYQLQMANVRKKEMKPEAWALIEESLIVAASESMRWHSNRLSFLMANRTSESVRPFQQMAENYAHSPSFQINLAWSIYNQFTVDNQLDRQLINAAKELAQSVSEKAPDNAICFNVYAHLLFAAGENDLAIETFKLALAKASDKNRARIESDYKTVLEAMVK